jgi:diaminohydroxyphosphoribosylaminopyrimidine deaminase/5-amino-6-(5-phosphoribosylamino)uracil reductase
MQFNSDEQAMRHALEWARKAMYITTPNPRVGCVLVRDGKLIGAGHTLPPGQAHAEVQALADARAQSHAVEGATAYVTLEPCSHFGRTPPCVDALIAAGVGRVVVAVGDPNPLVGGAGLAKLRAAGIEVTSGVQEDEARELNIGFFSRMQRGRPWLRLKAAASLDGKTALHDGRSQWITSQVARACAILTGIGTVRDDDPQLNVRAVPTPRQPRRVVIDSRLEIDPAARVLHGGGTWIACAERAPEKEARLIDAGHEILFVPNARGKVDLAALMQELGRRGINEVHGEAGFKLNGSMVRERIADELLLYLAPSILGDAQGMFDLAAIPDLDAAVQLAWHDCAMVGSDLRLRAYFKY